MSLLSDLLSKISNTQPRKDVPPAFRSTISLLKGKETVKKRLIIITVSVIVVVVSGFIAGSFIGQITGKKGTFQDSNLKIQDIKSRVQKQEPKIQDVKTQAPAPPSPPLPAADIKPEAKSAKPEIIASYKKETRGKKKPLSLKKSRAAGHALNKEKQKIAAEPPVNDKPAADSPEKDSYLYIANTFEAKKDYPRAIASYKEVLLLDPRNYRVLNNIASLLVRTDSFEEAKAYSQMTLNIKRDYVPGLINMGIALAGLKEPSAEGYLLQVLKLEPDNRYAVLNLAILSEKQGNYRKAAEYYSKLQRLGDAEGRTGLERLSRTDKHKVSQ